MSEIPSTPADGSEKVIIVPAIADTSKPTVAELTAAGVVDISCYLTADGFTPSMSEETISDSRKCSRQEFEQPGRSKHGLEVKYIDNTNAPNALTDNKAKDTLIPGSTAFVVTRRGKDFDLPIVAADLVSIYPIKPGQYSELPGEANSVLKIGQKLFVTGEVKTSVKVIA